jgi:hypothetical protein
MNGQAVGSLLLHCERETEKRSRKAFEALREPLPFDIIFSIWEDLQAKLAPSYLTSFGHIVKLLNIY